MEYLRSLINKGSGKYFFADNHLCNWLLLKVMPGSISDQLLTKNGMFLKHNAAGIFWALMILILSVLPQTSLTESPFDGFDKAVHAIMYGVLIVLLIVGFKKQTQFKKIRYFAIRMALTFSIIYGILTEILQMFTGRHMDIFDMLANITGCFLGVGMFFLIYGKE